MNKLLRYASGTAARSLGRFLRAVGQVLVVLSSKREFLRWLYRQGRGGRGNTLTPQPKRRATIKARVR